MTLSVPRPAPPVLVGGCLAGPDHRRALRDGQDGLALASRGDVHVGIVTDGCGSGAHSEVGARLGARWLAALCLAAFDRLEPPAVAAEGVARALTRRLSVLARTLGASGRVEPAIVNDYLLFTFLAVVRSPRGVAVFGVGDGLVVVDGRCLRLEAEGNAPDYVGYRVLGRRADVTLHASLAPGEAASVAVATDGLTPVADDPAAIARLVSDPAYARNASLPRKRLVALADRGVIHDDAAIAISSVGGLP